MVVKGLGIIGSVSGSGASRSQDILCSRLSSVLKLIGPNVAFNVVKVIVYSARSPIYDVELDSSAAVEKLLQSFYRYWHKRDPVQKPAELDKVSIFHSVTPGTRIRIALLRVSCFFYLASSS